MTSSLGFYIKPNVKSFHSFEDNELTFDNVEEDEDFGNADYIQDVPYTSSSADRSSIGSIPWADDAIKINQLEWEKIEKMLSGREPLPVDEDLRKEITDWQHKFSQISYGVRITSKHITDMDYLHLETEDNLDVNDQLLKPGHRINHSSSMVNDLTQRTPCKKSPEVDDVNLTHMLQNLTLTSVPIKISQRSTKLSKRKCASSSSSYSLRSPPTPVFVPIANPSVRRLRMPPILSVIETTRKFRNIAEQHKNPSFVQLTEVQKTKSAIQVDDQRSRFKYDHKSAWHLPLTANRFFNNKNSIVLPAISPQQQVVHQYTSLPKATNSTFSEVATANTTPSSTRGNTLSRNSFNTFLIRNNSSTEKRNFLRSDFSSNGSTTLTNTSNSGRSISAAIQYPRTTAFNALYLPYSASKFHAFN